MLPVGCCRSVRTIDQYLHANITFSCTALLLLSARRPAGVENRVLRHTSCTVECLPSAIYISPLLTRAVRGVNAKHFRANTRWKQHRMIIVGINVFARNVVVHIPFSNRMWQTLASSIPCILTCLKVHLKTFITSISYSLDQYFTFQNWCRFWPAHDENESSVPFFLRISFSAVWLCTAIYALFDQWTNRAVHCTRLIHL